jgi:hypothetical protein
MAAFRLSNPYTSHSRLAAAKNGPGCQLLTGGVLGVSEIQLRNRRQGGERRHNSSHDHQRLEDSKPSHVSLRTKYRHDECPPNASAQVRQRRVLAQYIPREIISLRFNPHLETGTHRSSGVRSCGPNAVRLFCVEASVRGQIMWKLMTKPNCMRDRKTGSRVARAAVMWPPILAEVKHLLLWSSRDAAGSHFLASRQSHASSVPRLRRYLGLYLAFECVLRVRGVAHTGIDLGAVIKDAARVGEGFETPSPVVLAHSRITHTSKGKLRD